MAAIPAVAFRTVDVTAPRPAARRTSTAPVATLTRARSATAVGDPTTGMTKNGITNVAVIDPAVFAASNRPALAAIRSGSSPSSVDDAGNVNPMTAVAGRTTMKIGPRTAWTVSS